MKKLEIKNKSQNLYYRLRNAGASHAIALAAVVEFILASLPDSVPATQADESKPNKAS